MRYLHLLLVLAIGLSGAASVLPAAPPGQNVVTVQFSVYAWNGDIEPLVFGPGRELELIEASTRSKIQNYTGPALLQFTQAGPVVTEPGQKPKPRPVVASVELPAGVSRVTLLTARVAKGRYQIYAIPEDGDTLPEGSIRLHNITRQKLMVSYDEKPGLELEAGHTTIITPARDATLIRVACFLNGRWREIFNNVAVLNQDRRQNVLLNPGISNQGINIYTLPAWPRSPEPAAPGAPATGS